MTFDLITAGLSVFLDANIFLYYFTAHAPTWQSCEKLLDRIENKEIAGYTSTQVLGEVAHRLMTIEACLRFTWPSKGIAQRLRNHPAEVQQLTRHQQAVDEITLIGVEVLPIFRQNVSLAVDISRQTGLLYSDALVVAVMRDHGLTHLASHDADFDRVPGLTRYAPI
jgi:predicted nucleic acid-binding protein